MGKKRMKYDGRDYELFRSTFWRNYWSPLDEKGEMIKGEFLRLPRNKFCAVLMKIDKWIGGLSSAHPVLFLGFWAIVSTMAFLYGLVCTSYYISMGFELSSYWFFSIPVVIGAHSFFMSSRDFISKLKEWKAQHKTE